MSAAAGVPEDDALLVELGGRAAGTLRRESDGSLSFAYALGLDLALIVVGAVPNAAGDEGEIPMPCVGPALGELRVDVERGGRWRRCSVFRSRHAGEDHG